MASFSFEVTAGVATNAIAITNDKDRDKMSKMLGLVSSVEEELRESLGEKLQTLGKKQKEDPSDLSSIQQAFLGLAPLGFYGGKDKQRSLPLDRLDKQGSVVKFVARPESLHAIGGSRGLASADRTERTRSLIRLARQMREESGASGSIRIGRGISLDSLEEILASANVLDSSPPQGEDNGRSEDVNNNESDLNPEKSRKAEIEECMKLQMLMKEAGREKSELLRRLDAWDCLNSGALMKSTLLDVSGQNFHFSPSHCYQCSVTVAYHLLELWHKIFLVSPTQVDILDENFLEILLQDDAAVSSKVLAESKRQVVVAIATKSEAGGEIILTELRKRLSASQDINCSEILGKIIQVEGFALHEQFTQLAVEVLSRRR